MAEAPTPSVEPDPEPEPAPDPIAAAGEELEALIPQLPTANLVGGGLLSSTGSFLDQSGPPPPLDIPISFAALPDGTVVFVVPNELLDGSVSIEFDALATDGFTVVAETSLVGNGPAPRWVGETPAGTTMAVPAPGTTRVLPERVGAVVISDISTIDELVKISIWIYQGELEDHFSYANAEILISELLATIDAGLGAELGRILLEFPEASLEDVLFGLVH